MLANVHSEDAPVRRRHGAKGAIVHFGVCIVEDLRFRSRTLQVFKIDCAVDRERKFFFFLKHT